MKKHNIEWNIHHSNGIETNPIDFLFCFQGGSTREDVIRVHKVEFQYPVDEHGASLYWGEIDKAEYYILYTMIYHKQFEEFDPYGDEWYLNYTSIGRIASDYSNAFVYRSLEEVEGSITGWVKQLAYLLSFIAEGPEEAKEAAEKTGIISISPHEEKYDGYSNYAANKNKTLEDIAWYFNEFHSSIGIMHTTILKDKIYFNLDRESKFTIQLKDNKGYLEHWRIYDKKGTLCTVMTNSAFDAVKWLLHKANHQLPLRDFPGKYRHSSDSQSDSDC